MYLYVSADAFNMYVYALLHTYALNKEHIYEK